MQFFQQTACGLWTTSPHPRPTKDKPCHPERRATPAVEVLRSVMSGAKPREHSDRRDLLWHTRNFLTRCNIHSTCQKRLHTPSQSHRKLLSISQKRTRAFARQNAQFVARFSSFDSETPHCGVLSAQDDTWPFSWSRMRVAEGVDPYN